VPPFDFQRLGEESGEPETDPEIMGRWFMPYFGNIKGLDRTRVSKDRSQTLRNLICYLYPLVAPRIARLPRLVDAGWQPARLGNGIRNCLAVGHASKNRGVPLTIALFETDAALEPKEGARSFCRQWNSLQEAFAIGE